MTEIEQLKKDIYDLETFRNDLDRTQLTFPLDKNSIDIMHTDLMIPTGVVNYPYNPSFVPNSFSIQVSVNGKQYLLSGS